MFESEEQPVQALKCSFLRNLVFWVCMYIEEGSMLLIDFVDWVGSI